MVPEEREGQTFYFYLSRLGSIFIGNHLFYSILICIFLLTNQTEFLQCLAPVHVFALRSDWFIG